MGEDQSIFVMECMASLNIGGEKKPAAFETVDKGEPTLLLPPITNGLLYTVTTLP